MDRLVPYPSRLRSPPVEAERRSTGVLDQEAEGAEARANGEILHGRCFAVLVFVIGAECGATVFPAVRVLDAHAKDEG